MCNSLLVGSHAEGVGGRIEPADLAAASIGSNTPSRSAPYSTRKP